MWLLMFILSFILVSTFSLVGIFFTVLKSLFLLNYKYANNYFKSMAISLDQFGNVSMSGMFNVILVKSDSQDKFGSPDETISSVLGKNQRANELRYLGKRLVALLDWIEEDHSLKSIGS